MPAFDEIRFPSSDNRLQLFARIYPGVGRPILMMHGLTRNSADFEGLAARLAGRYRLIVPDQRGRGSSDWDSEHANYLTAVYCADMLALIERLGLVSPLLIGTSMGGLMAMMMAIQRSAGFFRGLVLNDVGPVIEQAGLDRIASYVGVGDPIRSWDDAVAYCRRTNGAAFPAYDDAHWLAFARRLMRENQAGVPTLAYDPAIAAGLSSANPTAVPPNLWPLWKALSAIPALVIRGDLSDILSAQTVEQMAQSHPVMRAVTVSGVGHAPMLDEPEAIEAIESFIAAVDAESLA